MIDLTNINKIYIKPGSTDLRMGIDGFLLYYKRIETGTIKWHQKDSITAIAYSIVENL